jgi:hypothetical protein
MLIRMEHGGSPKHIEPVPYIERVPSRREAYAAYSRIVDALPQDAVEALIKEIRILGDFVWSR